jgi:hypothetical protein
MTIEQGSLTELPFDGAVKSGAGEKAAHEVTKMREMDPENFMVEVKSQICGSEKKREIDASLMFK